MTIQEQQAIEELRQFAAWFKENGKEKLARIARNLAKAANVDAQMQSERRFKGFSPIVQQRVDERLLQFKRLKEEHIQREEKRRKKVANEKRNKRLEYLRDHARKRREKEKEARKRPKLSPEDEALLEVEKNLKDEG
jgi:hypothetical protein